MNDAQLKAAAFRLAEKTPPHLGISAFPPQRWIEVEPGIIRVLMADGRSIRARLAGLIPPPVKSVETKHVSSPVHAAVNPAPPVRVVPVPAYHPESRIGRDTAKKVQGRKSST